MTKQTAYMKSNFKRRKNDHYPTIDTRCVDAFLAHFGDDARREKIVDICSPNGSAIVDYLRSLEYKAVGVGDAFQKKIPGNWILTNTPYERKLVKPIMVKQIERVTSGELGINGQAAFLLRTGFDHAQDYAEMFDSPHYAGQIKMRFRPWWTKSRRIAPFHNFVWHIWTNAKTLHPFILYYTAPFDIRYAVKPKGKKTTPRDFAIYFSHYMMSGNGERDVMREFQHVEYFRTLKGAIKHFDRSAYKWCRVFKNGKDVYRGNKL